MIIRTLYIAIISIFASPAFATTQEPTFWVEPIVNTFRAIPGIELPCRFMIRSISSKDINIDIVEGPGVAQNTYAGEWQWSWKPSPIDAGKSFVVKYVVTGAPKRGRLEGQFRVVVQALEFESSLISSAIDPDNSRLSSATPLRINAKIKNLEGLYFVRARVIGGRDVESRENPLIVLPPLSDSGEARKLRVSALYYNPLHFVGPYSTVSLFDTLISLDAPPLKLVSIPYNSTPKPLEVILTYGDYGAYFPVRSDSLEIVSDGYFEPIAYTSTGWDTFSFASFTKSTWKRNDRSSWAFTSVTLIPTSKLKKIEIPMQLRIQFRDPATGQTASEEIYIAPEGQESDE